MESENSNETKVEDLVEEASILFEKKKFIETYEILKKAKEMNPEYFDSKYLNSKYFSAYYKLGSELHDLGKHEESKEVLNETTKIDQEYTLDSCLELTYVLFLLKRYEIDPDDNNSCFYRQLGNGDVLVCIENGKLKFIKIANAGIVTDQEPFCIHIQDKVLKLIDPEKVDEILNKDENTAILCFLKESDIDQKADSLLGDIPEEGYDDIV